MELGFAALSASTRDWALGSFRDAEPGPHFSDMRPGARWAIEGGDMVTSAPELPRLTLNVAVAHHDSAAGRCGRRLYGGHTIGLAAAQATRALPNLVTVVAWHGCDHVAPVYEGDTLHSDLELERAEPLDGEGGLVHLRSRVSRRAGREARRRLVWRFVAVMG